jgi:hypothetical protein
VALEQNKDLKRATATVDELAARALVAITDFAPQMNVTTNAPAFGKRLDLDQFEAERENALRASRNSIGT